jgi:hydroxymethylpyrimidine pyrophosphatase-like HAD family hydrolase
MTYVVDIDGVIIHSAFNPATREYVVCEIDHDVVEAINRRYEAGDEIILHTGRHWDNLRTTLDQLASAGVKYHSLVMGKPVGDYYIDDRNLSVDEFRNLA